MLLIRSSGHPSGDRTLQWSEPALILFVATALSCAGSRARTETTPDPCGDRAALEARLPSEPWAGKLEPEVANELFIFRQDAVYARCSSSAPRFAADRTIGIDVQYTGEVSALQAAGLQTGLDENGRVSGIIAMRSLEALARVPGVVRIHADLHAAPAGH